jgi:hypothetical protein
MTECPEVAKEQRFASGVLEKSGLGEVDEGVMKVWVECLFL